MDLDELERLEREDRMAYLNGTLTNEDAVFTRALVDAAPELIAAARERDRLRAELAAALERAEKAERERDEARASEASDRLVAVLRHQHGIFVDQRMKAEAERDEARAEVERVTKERAEIADALIVKAIEAVEAFKARDRAEAEVERLRPVVVEAVREVEAGDMGFDMYTAVMRLLGVDDEAPWGNVLVACRQYIKENER